MHKVRLQAEKAKDLAHAYRRSEPKAITLVNELLASTGRTMHDFVLQAFPHNLDQIERINRLISIAETRRNISLRESNGVGRCSAKRCGGT